MAATRYLSLSLCLCLAHFIYIYLWFRTCSHNWFLIYHSDSITPWTCSTNDNQLLPKLKIRGVVRPPTRIIIIIFQEREGWRGIDSIMCTEQKWGSFACASMQISWINGRHRTNQFAGERERERDVGRSDQIAWVMGCSEMELPRFMELSIRRGSQCDLHINRILDALIDTA